MARVSRCGIGPASSTGFADHVDDAPERAVADRHRDRLAGVGDLLAAHQALARIHGDGAHGQFAEVLRNLEHQAVALVLGFQRVEDRRQMIVEMNVDDGADDLGDTSDIGSTWSVPICKTRNHSASAPEMISISSLVICAWRVRLYLSVCRRIMSPALRVALSIADICAP